MTRFAAGSRGLLGWVVFTVVLVAPLYVLAAVVVIRSDIFSSGPLTDTQYQAMWTFIASGLATAATILAALLTKSHNDRAAAMQAESESRKAALEKETEARQRLDTVVTGLGLMTENGSYAPKAVLAGALSTLVKLGHPPVASRVLAAALDDSAVDKATASWLIDSMMKSAEPSLREEGAAMLRIHGGEFTLAQPGSFEWPECMTAAWPSGLSGNAGLNALQALMSLLLSRDKAWWGDGWAWILYSLDEAVTSNERPVTKGNAARLVLALAPHLDHQFAQGLNDVRDLESVMARAREWESSSGALLPVAEIEAWGRGTAAPPASSGGHIAPATAPNG